MLESAVVTDTCLSLGFTFLFQEVFGGRVDDEIAFSQLFPVRTSGDIRIGHNWYSHFKDQVAGRLADSVWRRRPVVYCTFGKAIFAQEISSLLYRNTQLSSKFIFPLHSENVRFRPWNKVLWTVGKVGILVNTMVMMMKMNTNSNLGNRSWFLVVCLYTANLVYFKYMYVPSNILIQISFVLALREDGALRISGYLATKLCPPSSFPKITNFSGCLCIFFSEDENQSGFRNSVVNVTYRVSTVICWACLREQGDDDNIWTWSEDMTEGRRKLRNEELPRIPFVVYRYSFQMEQTFLGVARVCRYVQSFSRKTRRSVVTWKT
jgi:hypothetical protein